MNPLIRFEPLGAAREVGRSCFILTFQDSSATTRVLLDCGAHIGYRDERRWPNFTNKGWTTPKALNENINCVLLTHFHLDHCGALPYLTETLGYQGPVIMTYPTIALCPVILSDYWTKSSRGAMTSKDVHACFRRATAIGLEQRMEVGELYITAYYAGHVLGACMFLIEYRGRTVFYTGDFNMSPDRLIGAAKVPDLGSVDVVITEGTYCTTNRDSKRSREQTFLTKISDTLEKGGKVLIPCFAVGRSQELAMMCEQHWEKNGLSYPLRCSRGMSEQAFHFYRLFTQWTHPDVQNQGNLFHFPHVSAYDRDEEIFESIQEPQVLFASSQMLDFGLSQKVFARWAPNGNNLVIFPGYCPKSTLGNKVLGGCKEVLIDEKKVPVNCEVMYYSLAEHSDSRGIRHLLLQLKPRNVILVHGQEDRLVQFKEVLKHTLGEDVSVFVPETNEEITIRPHLALAVDMSSALELGPLVCACLLSPETPLSAPRLVPSTSAFRNDAKKRGMEFGVKTYRLRRPRDLVQKALEAIPSLEFSVKHGDPTSSHFLLEGDKFSLSCVAGGEVALEYLPTASAPSWHQFLNYVDPPA